jgi:hypothetical protein
VAQDIDALIEGHFADELDAEQQRTLRAALTESAEHRARYDARARLLRALADAEPSKGEAAALWSRLEDELDAPREAARAKQAPSHKASPLWLRWLSAAVAIGLVGGMIFHALRAPPRPPDRTIKGAGALGAQLPALGSVALQVYAIGQLADGGFATPRPVATGAKLTLRDFVQFRYANDNPQLRVLYIGAIRGRGSSAIEGAARLYYPRPGSETPLTIERSASMRTVGRSIRVGARHQAGELTLVAIFAERAQPRERVERTLRGLASGADKPLAGWQGKVALLRQRYRVVAAPRDEPKAR